MNALEVCSVRGLPSRSPQRIKMTLENGTYAVFESKSAELLRILAEIANWLGGRDSNPDTVVQSHVSYRWTTSQYGPKRGGTGICDYMRSPTRRARRTEGPLLEGLKLGTR